MEKDLEYNPALFNSCGIINRRDFFLNTLYALMIISPLWITYSAIISMPKLVDGGMYDKFLIILLILSYIVFTLILLPSCIKRFNDIRGIYDKNFNISVVAFTILLIILVYFNPLLFIIFLGIYCFLQFKKGKITGKSEYNIENDFNWGACFGTWLWGIVNKSYKTLWMIPLALTPLGFIFSLICGLNGNKWAIKNRDWESIEHFREAQGTQAIIFVILNLFITPILIFVIVFILTITMAFKFTSDISKNPDDAKKSLERMENVLEKMSSIYFESYEITPTENKFYIYPSAWSNAGFKDKTKLLDIAASMSVTYREKQDKNPIGKYYKSEELKRTVLYNCKNKNEVLARYVESKKLAQTEKPTISEMVKETYKSYKFYDIKD